MNKFYKVTIKHFKGLNTAWKVIQPIFAILFLVFICLSVIATRPLYIVIMTVMGVLTIASMAGAFDMWYLTSISKYITKRYDLSHAYQYYTVNLMGKVEAKELAYPAGLRFKCGKLYLKCIDNSYVCTDLLFTNEKDATEFATTYRKQRKVAFELAFGQSNACKVLDSTLFEKYIEVDTRSWFVEYSKEMLDYLTSPEDVERFVTVAYSNAPNIEGDGDKAMAYQTRILKTF